MTAARKLHTPTLITALIVLAVFAVHLQSWRFLCDDAYISFRYAKNFAASGELAYNLAPLERVEGYTNFLWVLLLAAFEWVGVAAHAVAPWLNASASGLCLLLSVGILRECQSEGQGAVARPGELFLPAVWLALTPEFVVWGSGGLEGSLALAFGLACLLNALRGRWNWSAAMAAAAVLTRPDAVIWLAPSGLLCLLSVRRRVPARGPTLPALAKAAAILLLPLLAHLVWRRVYYGLWMPNTFAVKASGAALRADYGVAYLVAWCLGSGVFVFSIALPLARRVHVALLAGALANLGWGWWVGGDFMAYGRFLLPATCLCAIVGGGVLVELRAKFAPAGAGGPRAAIALVIGAAFALACAWRLPGRVDADRSSAWLDKRWESVDGMHRFAAVRVAAGTRMREKLPAGTRVSVGAAGALPYASGLQAFDAYGLVDPGVATSAGARVKGTPRPGHQFHARLPYMKSREPELMCHVGWAARADQALPAKSLARRRAGAGWSWYCIDTGVIEGPRDEQMPAHHYCCPMAPDLDLGGRP